MIRTALALLFLMLVVASAAPAAPKPPASQPLIADSPGIPFLAKLVGRSFFAALVGGELEALLPLCDRRVNFDGTIASTPEQVKQRLKQLIERARNEGLRLSRLVMLNQRDMRRLYGRAPRRIRSVIRPGQVYALGRFQRLGAVVVLQRIGRFWRVVGMTD